MGPLEGLTVIEVGSIGPGPFCAMMLADHGARVIRIERRGATRPSPHLEVLHRNRRSIALDLKADGASATVLRLLEDADALIEGFRPGVMERLGLGPEVCHARNPRLVYGRMTGWGQDGPLAPTAGHDINYIALSGALAAIGEAGRGPVPPLNLVGDFGGGGMLLAFGLVCAILEARTSGKGQVVDAAMVDGATLEMAMVYGFMAAGQWHEQRGTNRLDGGAPYYATYQCQDGEWLAVGAIEPQFYAELLRLCGLDDRAFERRGDPEHWSDLKARFARVFAQKPRDEWCRMLEGTDACVTPVLAMSEVAGHPHIAARQTVLEIAGVTQPAPAPRYTRTANATPSSPPEPGRDTDDVLRDFGFGDDEIAALRTRGIV